MRPISTVHPGDLLHTFAVVHLNAPGNFMEDECPEARACDRFLNTYDEEVGVRSLMGALTVLCLLTVLPSFCIPVSFH
jgi:hypothetical protein